MAWDDYRLETKDGDVIIYLAPLAEWEPSATNDVTQNALPGANTDALVLDLSKWIMEITVQGMLDSTDNLPQAQKDAIFNFDVFSSRDPQTEEVTASEQVMRAMMQLIFNADPPYNLYLGEWEFTAASRNGVDLANGVLPHVTVNEIRVPEESGYTRNNFTFRFLSGNIEGES